MLVSDTEHRMRTDVELLFEAAVYGRAAMVKRVANSVANDLGGARTASDVMAAADEAVRKELDVAALACYGMRYDDLMDHLSNLAGKMTYVL